MPTQPYFSYGRNLNRDEMRDRCPKAICRGVADLADHQFKIVRHGVSTVVPVVVTPAECGFVGVTAYISRDTNVVVEFRRGSLELAEALYAEFRVVR